MAYKAIERGAEGNHVTEFQEALESMGHDLPRYGADGQAGSETFNAVEEFMWTLGRGDEFDEDGDEVPAEVVALVYDSFEAFSPPPAKPEWPGPWLHDFRLEDVSKQRGLRDWSKVQGITLHQTATCFLSSLDPPNAKLKKALARVKKIKAHFVALRCGHVAFNAPLDRVMAHGHAFNARDVGIEVDGYYAGVDGDLGTFWRPKSRPNRQPMQASEVQMERVRQVCKFICDEVARYGGKVRYIHAHRQTHRGKPSDPGEVIWKEVALYCKNELGLTDGGADYYVPHHKHKKRGGLSSKAGPGRPIPVQWDEDNTWDYRKRPKK